jgi:glutamate/tyrosine decarboxylase-like PLP-dependent enzyme
VYVEHQVLNWCKEIVGYPQDSSGILVGGGSLANITALIVARNSVKDGIIKKQGLKDFDKQLVIYCSTETHNCIFKAVETIGIGTDYLRKIPVNSNYQIDIQALEKEIEADENAGLVPFCIVGNAGTVNTGAIDDSDKLSTIARKKNIWLHIDGAIGAVVNLLPEFKNELKGMHKADSIAFDLHKWLYINYEAGCVLIRNAKIHQSAFSQKANYLAKHERGLAAGPDSFSSYGLELSRNFKSLKIWMSIKEHGIEKYARLIRQNIAQALYMESKIKQEPLLQMLTPVSINIVCFRFVPPGMNDDELNVLNKEILMEMQEQGIAAPSYTILNGKYAIRLSITNHRTKAQDLDTVIAAAISIGKKLIRKDRSVTNE